MKVDSEEQRDTLTKLLGTVTFTVKAENARITADQIDAIMTAIRTAGIDEDGTPVNRLEGFESNSSKVDRGVEEATVSTNKRKGL
ncbi:hypothetical protein LCGC14_2103280 [marine sediment metagenome]|uniref:Uncharacterized protein n=1 Tax=marine sediment metagenome TaxID=412755 RepID=A0A0F9E965_9ZZZZ